MAEGGVAYEPSKHAFRGFTDEDKRFRTGNGMHKKTGPGELKKQAGNK